MNPQLFLYLATLITTTLANELSYSPTNVFNTSEHDILNVRYLVEISPSRFHTEAAVDGTSDSMIITTIDPESLSNTLRAIVSAGESDFDHLKEAILSSNEAILSIATSQKYLSMILRESVESLSSAIDYNDRLRAYKTEVLPLLAANLIEKAKTDLYRRRRDEPVNTVLMDLVYDVYRRKEGYRMTTCSAVFDKTITKGSVSRYRHRIDCAEQPRLDHESVLEYISKGICVETVTEEVYVTQDIYNDKSKELPIGYRDEESFAMEYIRPSEILSLDSTYAIDCTNYASEILGNYYFHHLMAKRSDLMLCHGEPYVFPSLQADTSNCRRSSTGIGAFLNIGFSSMNFKKLTSLLSKPGSNSEAVVNIRSNFTNTLGSRRDVKVVGPPPCARACCSGEYHRQFQDFSGTEVLFESSYTGLWYSDTPNTDSFSSLIEFMKGDLPTPYESSSEGVFYYKSGRKLYLGKLVKTLVTKVDEGYMTCFNGILKLTNFTVKKVPLVKIPSEISYCKSNSRIIVPAISKRDDIYVINDNTQKYSIGEDCPPDSDDCEFFRSFDCDFTGKCSARDVARMYTSEASRCNNVIRVDCRNSTECVTIPDAEFILVDEETKELCSVKFNSTSTVINNYEIKTNSTEHIDQKIEELINEQIKTVEESLDRTIVNVRESSLKLEAYESAFRNITIELNLTYYRVGEEIAKVKADVKELKARMDAVETDIKILDYRTNALDKKIDNVNKRLDNGDFKHGGDVDIAKGFEDLGEGALDLIRGVIKLPFQAGSFIDVVIKVVCYIAIGLICLFILYCLFQLIRCIMPIFKSWNHKRNLEEVKERVAKRSEKIMDTPSEAQREIVPMFGTLTRRRTQDELEMHELSRSSIYFTEDLTVVGRPDKKFSVVEVENLPTIKLLKLCNLIKKVSSSEGEYYLIRKSAPAEKPSVLRHYDLDSDACKYIVFAYRNGGFRIHF